MHLDDHLEQQPVPLSPEDQRTLDEMARHLAAEDPALVARVRGPNVHRFATHKLIAAALVFVAATVFMFFTFASNVLLGFFGVVVMFMASIVITNSLRGIAKTTRPVAYREVDLERWLNARLHRRESE